MNVRTLLPIAALVCYLPGKSQSTGKNMAKVNLSAFVGKGFGLQYERQVGKRFTVAVGYSKIPTSTIAFKSLLESQIGDPDVKIGDFKLGTSIFTPEVRFYVGKKGAFHGFYLAPYGRFGHYNIQGPISYTTSTNSKRDLVFSGSLTSTTGGLMLGSSFNLTKRLYLDWWIIGGSIGSANGDFLAQTPLTETEQRSLRENLESIDIPFTTIKSTVTSTGATITTTGSMAGVRGLGINLGIRF